MYFFSGPTFKIKEKTQLYTGVYIDYGLTNLAKETPDLNIAAYDPNGINNTQANGTIGNKRIVQDTLYLSAGVQLKLGFSLAKDRPQPTEAKTETVVQAQVVAPVQQAQPVQQKVEETAPAKKEPTIEERNYIEKIESNRMHLFSKGESEPLVLNNPAENKPINRRVSLTLVDGK